MSLLEKEEKSSILVTYSSLYSRTQVLDKEQNEISKRMLRCNDPGNIIQDI
jgi:hypothetical protein